MADPIGFVRALWPAAKRFEAAHGIPAAYVVAMAANETGWDISNPYLFGIKGRSLSGNYGTEQTQEQRPDGTWYTITSEFQTYTSFDDALANLWAALPGGAPTDSPGAFASWLQGFGWASALNYATQIASLIGQVSGIVAASGLPDDPGPGPGPSPSPTTLPGGIPWWPTGNVPFDQPLPGKTQLDALNAVTSALVDQANATLTGGQSLLVGIANVGSVFSAFFASLIRLAWILIGLLIALVGLWLLVQSEGQG